jgi:hypothetical protein
MSEAGDAPYGDHIVLAPSFWPLGQYYGEVVFAGYCPGGPEFRWLDEYHLKVTYQAGNVVKRTDTFGDIRIQYEIVEETPYQQAAQLTQ